ncbi:MAG: ABC transporter permease [Cellulomonadaceae bacterium]|jgi:ABC-2 type transport system permease protein|nr:ABC transporter permease [Cellulomonadaceae bacterium]
MRLTLVTAKRVLTQLRSDPRTIAMIMVLPCLIVGLIAWMFHGTDTLDRFGPVLIGFFPLFVMFLITSITTQRERSSGTLERLMTTPLRKGDLMGGYVLAFGSLSVIQALVVTGFALAVGMDMAGSVPLMILVAMLSAVLGCALGLAASAVARTEFQAVQMLPLVIVPQIFTAGIFLPREAMPTALQWIANVLPLTYSVDAMQKVTAGQGLGEIATDLVVVVLWIIGSIALGILTLRRRTD